MNIWFTADTHFSHPRIIEYCNRPFKSVDEMDQAIISNWNNKIAPKDLVYHLGDFGFGPIQKLREIKSKLNGHIEFIFGSHDKNLTSFFKSRRYLLRIKIEGQVIVLCHYAMRVWPESHYNSWHLYGHSHGRLENFGKSLDVGVDCWNFYPVSYEEIKQKMSKRPDNLNFVKKEKNQEKCHGN